MKLSLHKRINQLKKHRRYRNKLARRFKALLVHKQTRKELPKILKEFGL